MADDSAAFADALAAAVSKSITDAYAESIVASTHAKSYGDRSAVAFTYRRYFDPDSIGDPSDVPAFIASVWEQADEWGA